MGQESFTNQVRFKDFLGLNTKMSDATIDYREASGIQNVYSFEGALKKRKGSTLASSNAFKDKTDTTAKAITGLYTGFLGTTQYYVGTGGDAFKQFTGGGWTDRTGAVTITDSANNLSKTVTFFSSAAADIFITGFESGDVPIKWTGAGNAAALASTPGNFKYPVVHKNKLWVVVDDIVYFSALRNGESWDTTNDIARFQGDGEDVTGLAKFKDRIIVFKPSSIHAISGSSNRDLYIEQIVVGDGTNSPYSIQEIDSKRYGRILVFVNKSGVIKGFNGGPTLLPLGDYAEPLFTYMNEARLRYVTSMNMSDYNQYWASFSYLSNSTNSQIIAYDYFNDIHTGENGRPLSMVYYHTGINANAMDVWDTSGVKTHYVGNYTGQLLEMDSGFLDEAAGSAIQSKWQSAKFDFGDPSVLKMLTDLNSVTTHSTDTTLTIAITTDLATGAGTKTVESSSTLWGQFTWGTGTWSAASTEYARHEITPNPSTSETPIYGRYFLMQINHNTASEDMRMEEMLVGVTNLGQEAQYVET